MFGKHKGQHRLGASGEAVPGDAGRRRLLKGALGAAGLGIAGAVAPGAAHAGGKGGGGGWPCPPDEPQPGPGKPDPDDPGKPGPGKPDPDDPGKPGPGKPDPDDPGKPGPDDPKPCPPREHGRCVEWRKVDSWCDWDGSYIVQWASYCTSCGRKCEDYYECAGCC